MKIIHYAVVAVLVLGAVYYLWMKPPSLNPIPDSRAAEALALVQSHQAQGYPTILEAMTGHVRSMSERNRVARLGEWRVKYVAGISTRYGFSCEIRGDGAMVRTGVHLACRPFVEEGQCRVACGGWGDTQRTRCCALTGC